MYRTVKSLLPLFVVAVVTLASQNAYAQAGGGSSARDSMLALGAAIAIAIAVLGGALGQGRAATAALEGIARNPQASGKIFTPMIIALALTESLVLLAFLVASGLSGKIGT
jgi:F-type H+-transporting ATPase subunit c